MRAFILLLIGVVVGWAASGSDWSRSAFGEDKVVVAPPIRRPITVPQQEAYLEITTLDEAIAVLQGKLKESHSPVLPLVNKDAVRAAVVTSLEGTKRANAKAIRESSGNERRYLEASAKHFADVVTPIYESLLKNDSWPSRAFFITNDAISAHTIQLHVDVRQSDGTGYSIGDGVKLTGYALPILTVEFGDAGPAEENGTLILGSQAN
ncbi:hypothetical protein [Lacipirellula limnantheis]|uniref:Uncharacterized protein n=1 Tax=Lacipirellula limnantheis TaxID=2528024 RepID=A0A517U1M5_9BACT|nr:hypothetical protein [Lacipirellula limnantheis]QDT74526.1 hypothetical protein I41_37230 [Lacipirellula limnantheis]